MIAAGALRDDLLARRAACAGAFFEGESERIARLCRDMAERFLRGGRLLACGLSGAARSDARHVAVEFVHPVIVGKRALPALCVEDVGLLAEPDDMVVEFAADGGAVISGERFDPPSEDPFVRQEVVETLYHVLWELVHVFFEHRGSHAAGGGASSFLYPFLDSDSDSGSGERPSDEAVLEDVRRSVLMKARETTELRSQTLRDGWAALTEAAAALSRGGGALLALGNGGSATDAMDVVADLRAAGRRAIDLSGDPSILTAVANDIGVEAIFARQVIAYGRPGDVVLAISTSGGSGNVIAALAEARRRGLATIALVGYDGGRILAEGLADHVVVTRSQHIPRIQEAQATAYHALVELVSA